MNSYSPLSSPPYKKKRVHDENCDDNDDCQIIEPILKKDNEIISHEVNVIAAVSNERKELIINVDLERKLRMLVHHYLFLKNEFPRFEKTAASAKHSFYFGAVNERGTPHGLGTLRFSSGFYRGAFQNGLRHGSGLMIAITDGKKTVYDGNFADDLFQGLGKFTYSNGDEYIGQWNKNLKEGEGTYRTTTGTCFIGTFLDDKMERGKIQFGNGDSYCGSFKNNKFFGKAVYMFANGSKLSTYFD